MKKVASFLMFEGNAEDAMNYYISLIEDSTVTNIVRYGPDGPGKEGSVMQATFRLKDQQFMCIDSHVKHAFTFTPSFSIFVTCETESEIDQLHDDLLVGGKALMPLGNYGFSEKFAWITDKFGVSWQVNLP